MITENAFDFITAATNHYKLNGFNLQHKFIILPFCRLEVQHKSHWDKTKVLIGHLPFL